LQYALENGKCLLLLDGVDEIKAAFSTRFARELGRFADHYPKNQFIVSTRPQHSYGAFEKFTVLELRPFTKEQALRMVEKIDFRPEASEIKARFREQFEEELFYSHREFAESPLLLSIMLLIFGRTAKIPTKTYRFYKEAFAALFLAKAFARVSSDSKGAWSAFLIDFFERHGYHSYNNAILELLYDMAPEKVEEYIFTPYLEALFEKSDDIYLRFLGKLYPSLKLTYDYHDIVNEYVDEDSEEICEEDESYYDFSLDSDGMAKSGVMGFIVHFVLGLDADDENEDDDWPYEYDHIMEKVPLVVKELERLEDEERDSHEVFKDEHGAVHIYSCFQRVISGHWSTEGYYISVEDLRHKADQFPAFLSILISDDFSNKKICETLIPRVRKYLEALKAKRARTDNSFFGLLKF